MWLAAFVRAGARHLILRFGGEDQLAQLERAAIEVLPRIRSAQSSN